MTPNNKIAADFSAMINADRERRKYQTLAQEIFGKNRRSSAPGAGTNNRQPGKGASLASRVGIAKRTTSASIKPSDKIGMSNGRPAVGNIDAEWTHDLHSLNNSSAPRGPRGGKATYSNRNDRLHAALNGSASSPALNSQFNIIKPKPSAGISIRGLAGPYAVMAKNFAYGTTAADIESAMTPVGGVALSCVIITERPSVIAEIVFESKEGANNVVETFNNQNADGNLLHVYHKVGGQARPTAPSQSTPIASSPLSVTPIGPRSTADRKGYPDNYTPRERSRDRRLSDFKAREEIVDGSYGFNDQMDTDNRDGYNGGKGGLYSDSLVTDHSRGRGFGSRDNRSRGNDRGRGYR